MQISKLLLLTFQVNFVLVLTVSRGEKEPKSTITAKIS